MKATAEIAIAAQHLLALTEASRLYPSQIDENQAIELNETIERILIQRLEKPEWAEFRALLLESTQDDRESVLALIVAQAIKMLSGAKTIPEIDVETITREASQMIEGNLADLVAKIQEIIAFNCRNPEASSSAPRSFYLLTQYWNLYKVILDHHGTACIGYSPHPLLRFIVNLRDRIETCLQVIARAELTHAFNEVLEIPLNEDSNLAWEDCVQPRINDVAILLEEAKLQFLRTSFDLTKHERLFIELTEGAFRNFAKRMQNDWQGILGRLEATHSSCVSTKQLPKSCFESIRLAELEMRRIIKTILNGQVSEPWLNVIRESIGEDSFTDAMRRMKDRRDMNTENLLHYLYLSDLVKIINANWSIFRISINCKRQEFNGYMKIILKGRTEEAHHKPEHLWPEIEKQRVRVACHDFLARLASNYT